MGPRSRDRGINESHTVRLDYLTLQWGRDHVIAELTAACTVRSMASCFNGAAIT